jgi:Invasin, domain 3
VCVWRHSVSRHWCARALRLVLGAVLPIALSTYLLPGRAEAAGPVETITVSLSPSSIVADGVSTSAATATLSFGGVPLAGQTVAFSSGDSGIKFGPAIDNLDGTYTATVTGSTVVGTPTITATSQWAGQTASGEATLTQTPGPAKNMTLSITPRSIIADGSSFAIATAIVADAHGNRVPMDTVVFSSSDPGERIMERGNNGNGTYSAVIRSSTTPGLVAITATDTAANLIVRSELSQTASGSMMSLVTMQWTFHYTLAYTKVLSLIVNGAPAGAKALIGCHGRGCPFTRHVRLISGTKPCEPKGRRECATDRTIELARAFRKRGLYVGTRITVAITRPQWIGKYYMFHTRAGRPPRVEVACLAPGRNRPGAPC